MSFACEGVHSTYYDEKGDKIELMKDFSTLMSWKYGEIRGWCVINGVKEPVRICALRKDVINEYKGVKRLKREKGTSPISAIQKEYNKYIIVITSVGKEVSTEQLLDLYRMCCQI